MPSSAPKILILSSDTGGGHRSAAQALAEGVQRFWHSDSSAVRIIRAVEESHHVTEKLVNLYNWVLRHKQGWMKYLYWAVNRSSFSNAAASATSATSSRNGARTSLSASTRSRSTSSRAS